MLASDVYGYITSAKNENKKKNIKEHYVGVRKYILI